MTSTQAFLQGLIDYAGLFPPAKLPMAEVVRNYASYLRADHSWMLGRLIVPASKLEEFRRHAREYLPTGEDEQDPWPLSVLIDGDLDADLDAIYAFNREHAHLDAGLAVIDAVEIKVPIVDGQPSAVFVDDTLDKVPDELFPFFELPAPCGGVDIRGCLAVLADADAGAKLRTGGVTPEAIPTAQSVAEFIAACAVAEVPFKATAGLHHAVRAEHALTYEAASPRAVMHGFVNVFAASVFARTARATVDTLVRVLEERDLSAFVRSDARLVWRELSAGVDQVEDARLSFALSYGSCSFEEPVAEITGT